MIQHIVAIYDHGIFRPLQPIALPEGMKVHLSIDQQSGADGPVSRICSPRLADPSQSMEFEMEVHEG
jgi:predicted DNA-binding antitoxin AbrB/MazE fold protein